MEQLVFSLRMLRGIIMSFQLHSMAPEWQPEDISNVSQQMAPTIAEWVAEQRKETNRYLIKAGKGTEN